MSESLVTVLMATYNHDSYLRQALDSLLDQTLDRDLLEIIVINDGSTDDTSAILSDYQDTVRLVEHDNRGLVPCCNEGLRLASGPYFARLDSDDLVDPTWLQLLLEALQGRPRACAAVPDRWELTEAGTDYVSVDEENVYALEACGTLFRTEQLVEVGGFRKFFWEEYDLYLRLRPLGKLVRVPHGLYTYRRHPDAMTADSTSRAEGWEQLLGEWGPDVLRAAGFDSELDRILADHRNKARHRDDDRRSKETSL